MAPSRPWNRSDLGRLYLSRRAGTPDFRLIGDGSLDGMASTTTVTMAGSATLVSPKSWTGTATARPGYALAAAAMTTDPVDLLVLYGNQCDIVQQTGYTDAVLVEGVVFNADTYTAFTSLTSDTRNIVSSTHTLAAEQMLRVSASSVLYRLKTFDGKVVAICRAGKRVYALVAKDLTGSFSLTLAWSDAIRADIWHSALIDGTYADPATLSPAGTWSQAGLAVLDGDIYISTAADILRVAAPAPGVTTVYPQPVRTVGYAPYGSPDQLCRMVGLHAQGEMLYAGSLLGQLWRIAASGTVLARSVGGTLNRTCCLLDDGSYALVEDAAVRVVAADRGGWQRNYTGWLGAARFVCGTPDDIVVFTSDGATWTQTGAGWAEGWNFDGALVAITRASHNLFYAIAVRGLTNQVWVSVTGGLTWTEIGDPSAALTLSPLPDGKCLVGGDGFLSATAPTEQLIVA